ncbi:Nramp family divalent metal transporter [Spirosoma radiotolerans]|uniref:Natural resistance-associated macrophage protein n=1 Tax=Spirosoma radiotolerans TaxID=1379870 RepID=A0A0E3ZY90_9BACT|nr:Nramp family divalent metal transporter [Spirosoma radiotolerans]AKD56683.1 natural resistance-associated macrophage protein [Spirosoma radiotolerans]
MPKVLSLRSGLGSVLFWSVISAAFIGPGSVTACAIAGSTYGLQLLWVLTFSTLGTVWLQEAAARITIATGNDLGQVIVQTYAGPRGRRIAWALFLAIFLGCAAYQAGNILGAVSGLALLTGFPVPLLTIVVGLVCVVLLWVGSTQGLANMLGLVVFAMGGAFLYVAFGTPVTPASLASALVTPAVPSGSLLLINGLIGTTIVPYNLFFGSSIVPTSGDSATGESNGQSLGEMKLGIWVAVILGGIISVVLLLAGLLIPNDFSYAHMAQVMTSRIGPWAGSLFAFGLFAAGFASSLTAPLAASVTAHSLLGVPKNSLTYRAIWLIVLTTGLVFGLLNVTPIPVIVAVQAINGILLPFVTVFLFLAVNNKSLLGDKYCNTLWQNIAMGSVVLVTAVFGLWNVWLAIQAI